MNGPADVPEVAGRAQEIFSLAPAGDEFFINHTHGILGVPPCDRRKVTETVFTLVTYNYRRAAFLSSIISMKKL